MDPSVGKAPMCQPAPIQSSNGITSISGPQRQDDEIPKLASALPENQITPEPVLEKRTRRRFTPDYKLRIIAEADTCQHGELGVILRREKLYSNPLSDCCVSTLNTELTG